MASDEGVSQRISNEGDGEQGSGDYRNQHRRGGNQEDEEEFDAAENGDTVYDQLHTHPSVVYERTPTHMSGRGQGIMNFNCIQSNRDSQYMNEDMLMDPDGLYQNDDLYAGI